MHFYPGLGSLQPQSCLPCTPNVRPRLGLVALLRKMTISDRIAGKSVPYHQNDPFDIVFEGLLPTTMPIRAGFCLGL